MARVRAEIDPFPDNGPFNPEAAVRFDASTCTLQQLLDSCAPYTVVYIPPGEYSEELVLRAPVYLKGEEMGQCVIRGLGANDTVLCQADPIGIDALVIAQAESHRGSAISVTAGFTRLLNCTVSAPALSAVAVSGSAICDIQNCEFTQSHNAALYASETAMVRVEASVIHGSKTYGVGVHGNSTVYLNASHVFANGGAGICVISNGNLHLTNSQVYENSVSGIEVTSRGHVHIESCTIRDHPNGISLLVKGNSGVYVTSSLLASCGQGTVKLDEGAVIQSVGNEYKDAGDNAMLLCTQGSVAYSENDVFSGSGKSALAVANSGRVEMKGGTIQDMEVMAAMLYDAGVVVMSDSTIQRVARFGFQATRLSVVELTNVTMTQVACGLLGNQIRGFARGCTFSNSSNIGAEMTDVSEFEFEDCTFSGNETVGISYRESSAVRAINCRFDGNLRAGVDINGRECRPLFANCQFRDNGVVGANVIGGSSPKFVGGLVARSGKVGISVAEAAVEADALEVAENKQAGLSISDGSTATFTRCLIRNNPTFSVQIHTNRATATFEGTHFTECGSVHLFAIEGGSVLCRGCKLDGSNSPHCEVREEGHVTVDGCDVSRTLKGIRLQVREGGKLRLLNTKVHHEQKFGVMVGDGGQMEATNTTVVDCAVGGIYIQGTGTVVVTTSRLENNGNYALQAEGGTITLDRCLVKNHRAYGVVLRSGAQLVDNGTRYEANGQKDVFHAT
jgi:hypothetical protein